MQLWCKPVASARLGTPHPGVVALYISEAWLGLFSMMFNAEVRSKVLVVLPAASDVPSARLLR